MNLIFKSQSLNSLLAKAIFFFVLVVSFSACKEQEFVNPYYQTPEQMEAQKQVDEKVIRKYFRDNNVDTTKVVRTSSGLYHLTVTEGTGDFVKAGQQAEVHYIGWSVSNNKFDSSFDRGKALFFRVGATPRPEVIAGWDEGIRLMRVGEVGFLYIPSYLAYGYYGSGTIPPNSVLVFEMHVLSAK